MDTFQYRRFLHLIFALSALLILLAILCLPRRDVILQWSAPLLPSLLNPDGKHSQQGAHGLFDRLDLTPTECSAAFPNLTGEIDSAVAQGPFDLKNDSSVLVARINNGKLTILHAPKRGDMSSQWRERQLAALHQIHRAIVTSPSPLPSTFITLHIQDTPSPSTLSHSRPATLPSSPSHIFPIPHFSFWSWPVPNSQVHSLPHAARLITALERSLPFRQKDPRAVWRGTPWFQNGAGANPRLRQTLLSATRNASWADVAALDTRNSLPIESFCRYKYVIYTEGVSYSGRLPFHHLCESVLLSPPIEWMMHTTHLAKPVYSTELLASFSSSNPRDLPSDSHDPPSNPHNLPSNSHDTFTSQPPSKASGPPRRSGEKRKRAYPSQRAKLAWPGHPPSRATMVFVNPDWSDLEPTIEYLNSHPDVAEGIARRQRHLFAEKGYLSPAAEVCYWRAMMRGWSSVVKVDKSWDEVEGVTFEEFSVKEDR